MPKCRERQFLWVFPKLVVDLNEVGVGPTHVLPSVHGMDASKYYYCITSWCKAVTNELVWFGINTVGVPLSYYWHTLGCAIKHFFRIYLFFGMLRGRNQAERLPCSQLKPCQYQV